MNKSLYKTPVRRKKEVLFYVATFGGRKDVSLVIVTTNPIYWEVREELQTLADSGELEPVFEGGVHIRRVHRMNVESFEDPFIREVAAKIRRRFNAISYQDLEEIQKTKETNNLEKFFTAPSHEESNTLKQVIPFKKMKFEEYFLKVMRDEFPALVKNVSKEYKQRGQEFKIM